MTTKKEKAGILVIIITVLIIILAPIGWAMNIYEFATSDFKAPYKNEIVRGVGIPFAPLGAILGYIDIDDTPHVKHKTTYTIEPMEDK